MLYSSAKIHSLLLFSLESLKILRHGWNAVWCFAIICHQWSLFKVLMSSFIFLWKLMRNFALPVFGWHYNFQVVIGINVLECSWTCLAWSSKLPSLLLQTISESLWPPHLNYLVPIFCIGCFSNWCDQIPNKNKFAGCRIYLTHVWRDTSPQGGKGMVAGCFMKDEHGPGPLLQSSAVEKAWQWMASWRMSVQVGTSLLMSWQNKKQNSSGSFYIVMANLHCQLVWIWNHLQDISLGMSMRAFLERINVEGKTHPKVCGITPMD